MKLSDHPDAHVDGQATVDPGALVTCPACGQRVTAVTAWSIPKPIRPGAILQRYEPAERWFEMGPCGCEVDSFTYRTGQILDARATETSGHELPAPQGALGR